MPVSPKKRKSKIISIRVSPEEYDLLVNRSGEDGRRSVSALAREAMQRIYNINDNAALDVNEKDVNEKLRALDARLHLLQLEVSQLSHKVSRRFGS